MKQIDLIECPRDAMQGWPHLIPTAEKIRYINSLLKVGFHTIDFGSFVSAKAIPQMADTLKVLKGLDLSGTRSKLLAIVANVRGAEEALHYPEIDYLGFPFSISPTFQKKNTNSSIEESLIRLEEIQNKCLAKGKELVVYLSMGFGNPYGDPYNSAVLHQWAEEMVDREIKILSLADTVGLATPEDITAALSAIIPLYPDTEIGVHLHATIANRIAKLKAAVNAGCKRIDGAIKGIGGCPMAGNDLVGNMDSATIVAFLEEAGLKTAIDNEYFAESVEIANSIFGVN